MSARAHTHALTAKCDLYVSDDGVSAALKSNTDVLSNERRDGDIIYPLKRDGATHSNPSFSNLFGRTGKAVTAPY